MSKHALKFFLSYAHKTAAHKQDFLDTFMDHASMLKNYELSCWEDRQIILGERWHDDIQAALTDCDFGLLLLSAPFFNSKYIKDHELNHFIKYENDQLEILKPIIPVGLQAFPMHGDLRGLQHTQIYRYQKTPASAPKFYTELKRNGRIHFVGQLLNDLTRKLDKIYRS